MADETTNEERRSGLESRLPEEEKRWRNSLTVAVFRHIGRYGQGYKQEEESNQDRENNGRTGELGPESSPTRLSRPSLFTSYLRRSYLRRKGMLTYLGKKSY